MTKALRQTHHDLPRTDGVAHPARMMLHGLRPSFAAVIRRRWNVELRGTEHFPEAGPVIVIANHIGWLDGPMMAILSPRPGARPDEAGDVPRPDGRVPDRRWTDSALA